MISCGVRNSILAPSAFKPSSFTLSPGLEVPSSPVAPAILMFATVPTCPDFLMRTLWPMVHRLPSFFAAAMSASSAAASAASASSLAECSAAAFSFRRSSFAFASAIAAASAAAAAATAASCAASSSNLSRHLAASAATSFCFCSSSLSFLIRSSSARFSSARVSFASRTRLCAAASSLSARRISALPVSYFVPNSALTLCSLASSLSNFPHSIACGSRSSMRLRRSFSTFRRSRLIAFFFSNSVVRCRRPFSISSCSARYFALQKRLIV